jgi:hypothetical protein
MLLILVAMIDRVDAVDLDYVEHVFAGLALTSAIVATIGAICKHNAECDEAFFAAMKTERWSKAKVNEYMDDHGITGGMRSVVRTRLMIWVGMNGDGSTSSAAKTTVKIEPEVAAEQARTKARAENQTELEVIRAGKDASVEQNVLNERVECTSAYARALRAEGGEGVKIDRALMGEDNENEMVEEEDGSVVVKRPTAASVADKWKTTEDASECISEMQQRAMEDEKFYIVARLRAITDYLMLLSLPKRLPYVKKLFKSFYQGIPEAHSDKVLRKVNNDWEAGYYAQTSSGKSKGDESAEMKGLKAEIARLKMRSPKDPAAEDQRKCHLCKKTGHMIADCPEQCPECSSPGKQIHKQKCECEDA